MKKRILKRAGMLLLALGLAAGMGTGAVVPEQAEASAPPPDAPSLYGGIHIGASLLAQYGWQKTIDLTNSGVDVVITQEEKDRLLEQAKEDAAAYMQTEEAGKTAEGDPVDEASEYTPSQVRAFKTQEFYNTALGKLFVEKLGKQLDVSFSFDLVPLASDGSEDEAFDVDGEQVKRGTFAAGTESIPFGEADFGGENQLYDEIMNENMGRALDAAYSYYHYISPMEFIGRDGRDILSHELLFNLGRMTTSDYSQIAWGANMAGNTADFEGYRELLGVADPLTGSEVPPFNPRWSYNNTYKLSMNPTVKYIAEAVAADVITGATFDESGRLTSISKPLIFSGEGNIPKPGMSDEEVEEMSGFYFNDLVKKLKKAMGGDPKDGHYRFKLVESRTSPEKLPNGAAFKNNDQAYIADVIVKRNEMGGVSYSFDLISADGTVDSPRAEFVNAFTTEPKVKKTIEGSDKYTLKALDEEFSYEISTTMPEKGEYFQIVDELEQALQFAESDDTVISIGGKALAAEEKAAVLKQDNKRLTVDFDKAQVKKYAGQTIHVAFSCRLADDADFAAYENNEVPNLVQYNIDNHPGENTDVAILDVPDDLLITEEEEARIDDEVTEEVNLGETTATRASTPAGDKDKTVTQAPGKHHSGTPGGKGSKTGDGTSLVIPVLILILAAVMGGAVVIRRRRMNH